jgi:hypothetical protein
MGWISEMGKAWNKALSEREHAPQTVEVPDPPTRQALPGHGATITVEWGYEPHEVTITPEEWAAVMSGDAMTIDGAGYVYENQHFQDRWHFSGGYHGNLLVTYGEDGGTGVDCSLSDATIVEFLP